MEQHLFLVGYRGSGKSSIGRRLGELLGLTVVDSDELIEREAGKSIRVIFAEEGEPSFRDRESQVIERIVELPESTIVSLGGGAVLRDQNRELIKTHGKVVWLKASVDQVMQRISKDTTNIDRRPALTPLAAVDEIVKLMGIRQPMYLDVSDCIIQTDHRTIDDIAMEIAAWYSNARQAEKDESAS